MNEYELMINNIKMFQLLSKNRNFYKVWINIKNNNQTKQSNYYIN